MLAARSATRKNLARTFSTVSESAGFKVASVDDASRTAAVTLLVKAGSRFETKRGAAHVLKNFAFKVGCLFCWKILSKE
jgi:ubiquinol-cytochrome c reductase core subunit 2